MRSNLPREIQIIGASGHAKVVLRTAVLLGYRPVAIFDDNRDLHGKTLFQAPIVGDVELALKSKIPTIIAIGDNATRRRIAEKYPCDWISLTHPTAFVDSTVKIGVGSIVMAGAVVQPDAAVGNHAIINTCASVDHDCRIGDYVHIAPGARIAGGVVVGCNAFVGAGGVVVPLKKIGCYATIGAGACVVRDVPDGVVAIGTPARWQKSVR